jgi:hypothetical protein
MYRRQSLRMRGIAFGQRKYSAFCLTSRRAKLRRLQVVHVLQMNNAQRNDAYKRGPAGTQRRTTTGE